jgi:FkbM family methyltransferase
MNDWHPETLHVLGAISSKRVVPPAKVTVESLLYAQLSYSMSGEDSFIAKHFKDRLHARNPGFYVDIGSGAIWDISNTFMFYGHGWSGLCLDANPHNADEWKQWRPRDRHMTAAIGETEGQAFWHAHNANWGMARVTTDGVTPGEAWAAGVSLQMRRLDSLFADHVGDRKIQFMSIDVEGSELGVLRSNDWQRWRPELIMMECLGFDFAAPLALPAVAYLNAHGYRLDSKLGENLVFIRS